MYCLKLLATGKPQAIISEEDADEMEAEQESREEPRLRRPVSKKDSISGSLKSADGNNTSKKHIQFHFFHVNTCLHLCVKFLRWTSKYFRGNGYPANEQSSQYRWTK